MLFVRGNAYLCQGKENFQREPALGWRGPSVEGEAKVHSEGFNLDQEALEGC